MNFSTFLNIVFNDWDGAQQRMMINIGLVGAGWTGVAMNHAEFNLWVQTIASLVAFFILIWNFWGSQKELKRKRMRDEDAAAQQIRVSKAEGKFPKQKPNN